MERAGAIDGEAGPNDGENLETPPNLPLPDALSEHQGQRRGGAARCAGPGGGSGNLRSIPWSMPGPALLHGDARRPGDTSRRSPSRGLPPAWTRAEHDDFWRNIAKRPCAEVVLR